jgi:hypothetical protein
MQHLPQVREDEGKHDDAERELGVHDAGQQADADDRQADGHHALDESAE